MSAILFYFLKFLQKMPDASHQEKLSDNFNLIESFSHAA
jgi:hypothetical protein